MFPRMGSLPHTIRLVRIILTPDSVYGKRVLHASFSIRQYWSRPALRQLSVVPYAESNIQTSHC